MMKKIRMTTNISVANSAKTFLPKMDQDHRARLEAAYKRLRERKENLWVKYSVT